MKLTQGAAHFRFGDREEKNEINLGPTDTVRYALFKYFVAAGGYFSAMNARISPAIGRFGRQRPLIDSNPPGAMTSSYPATLAGVPWAYGSNFSNGLEYRSMRRYPADNNLALADAAMACGSCGATINWNSVHPRDGGTLGQSYVSFIDLPGTVIGNKFKHPVGRADLFNEVGYVALSQGDLAVDGVFDPPQNLAYHYAYQVYYTLSGGTGTVEGAVKTNGETFPATTNAYTFDDTTFNAFAGGDVGKYVVIHDVDGADSPQAIRGVFKITAVSSTSRVETDAVTINEGFTNQTGLTWTLRSGPIAEYFVRRRRYLQNQVWTGDDGVFQHRMHYHRAIVDTHYDWESSPGRATCYTLRHLHDRGCCWWSLQFMDNNTGYEGLGLFRYVDQGGVAWEPLYADGNMTNMPAGIKHWRYMDEDKNDKIWIATDDQTTALGWSVYIVDPYPLNAGEPDASTPDCIVKISKQANLASAGLPTSDAAAVICDNTNGDATHGRSWVICGNDGSVNGGIYYSEDGGSTMKGLVHEKSVLTGTDDWDVAGDGVTVTQDAGAGVTSTLLSELVAGEWITFEDGAKDESKRQIASVDSNTQLTLTAATAFGGADTNMSMKKGCIDPTWGGGVYDGGFTIPGNNSTDTGGVNCPIDHDSSGCLYWMPATESLGVQKFDPNSTLPIQQIPVAALVAGYDTFTQTRQLTVTRMPDPLGAGSVWHDNVWAGGGHSEGVTRIYDWESYTNSGVADDAAATFHDAGRAFTDDDVGKWVRIYKSASGNDGVYQIASQSGGTATLTGATFTGETNICWELFATTRYIYGNSSAVDDYPNVVYVWPTSDHDICNPSIVQDRANGTIYYRIRSKTSGNDAWLGKLEMSVPETHSEFGSIYEVTGWGHIYNYNWNGETALSEAAVNFDDLGMGTSFTCGYFRYMDGDYNRQTGAHHAMRWSCLVWTGSSWELAPFNDHYADLDFDASETEPGPYVAVDSPGPGNGTRRATDWAEPLEFGLSLRFNQAGGATSQEDEFVIDENTTFVCAIGRLKDNTMTATWRVEMNIFPTVVRLDESAVEIGSPWTYVNGWDGGYINSSDDQAFPNYCRGLAEGEDNGSSDGTTAEYFDLWSHVANNPAAPQYMASMRIHDEASFPLSGDLSIANVTGEGRATSATYDFVSGDVGKTIRVEGAFTTGNNTSKVIISVNSPGGGAGTSEVVLDSEWAEPADANEPLTWRLRDVPEVSYVVFSFFSREDYFAFYDWRLYSSRDGGRTWDQVKSTSTAGGLAVDDLLSTVRDPGVYFGRGAFNPVGEDDWWITDSSNQRQHLTFDLTTAEIDADQRRRTHWKIVRGNPQGASEEIYPMGVMLLDSNYAPVLAPELMPSDRLDPLWLGMHTNEFKLILHESAGAVTISQSAYKPHDFGNEVNEAGAGYWLQDDTDLKTYANTSKVSSALATFTLQDTGRKLRVPAADVTLGVDETYEGFLTIVSVDSANEVTVERTFDPQSTGSIGSVTDNGGQAVMNSTSHGMSNGDPVTQSGFATYTQYNGTFIVANATTNTYEIGVAYAGSEAGAWAQGQTGLTWATLNFGALDRVRFDNTADWFTYVGKPLASQSYKIIDVPTTNQILVEYMEIPDSITDSFSVERSFDSLTSDGPAYGVDFEDGGMNAYWTPRSGIWGVSDEAQFLVIDEDAATRTAASGADSDNDGWSDDITITGSEVTDAAVGDWLLLYNPSALGDLRYRRWYQIKSVSTGGGNTTIVTEEDEIFPSETFYWKIAKKKALKMRCVYGVVSGYEPM